jgi:hypothetical protein
MQDFIAGEQYKRQEGKESDEGHNFHSLIPVLRLIQVGCQGSLLQKRGNLRGE